MDHPSPQDGHRMRGGMIHYGRVCLASASCQVISPSIIFLLRWSNRAVLSEDRQSWVIGVELHLKEQPILYRDLQRIFTTSDWLCELVVLVKVDVHVERTETLLFFG